MTGTAIEQGETAIKTTRVWVVVGLVSEMPLSGHVRVVAALAEHFGEGDDPVVKTPFVTPLSALVWCQ